MMNSNITAYQNCPDEFQFYYGKASVKEGFYLANGDERFYHFIGKKSCLSIPELLHPEDVPVFMEAVEKVTDEPQCLIVRFLCYSGKYRCLYMVLKENGRIFNGFHSFDIEMFEIMNMMKRYKTSEGLVNKYREFMTLYSGRFLEYEYDTDMLKMYEYCNMKSRMIFAGRMEEKWQDVQQNTILESAKKAEFQHLYDLIRKGRDQFKLKLDAEIFDVQEKGVRYEIRCRTMYEDDVRDKVVGLVNVISGEQSEKSYYMSESAIDPGTGLLNKRAIHEYAIEKIQENPKGLYLAIMDVDDFKKVNDNFGHMYGDEVLAKVSEIIRGVLKERGMAGRFGGDEFMIIFENIDSETTLRRMFSTMSKHAQWAFAENGQPTVTFSIGVSKYPEDGANYEELFKKSDKCLYIAKAKGKNRYIIYNEEKHGAIVNEEDSVRSIGLKATISNDKKNDIVSELILKLHKEGISSIEYVMKQMQTYFDIDGIAVYAGEKMQRIFSSGKYMNPIQSYDCLFETVYQQYFDECGFYCESTLPRLEKKSPEAYRLNQEQEIGEFIKCEAFREKRPAALVSFDFFNRSPKFGVTDKGLVKMVGRLMAEVVAYMKVESE